RLRHGGPPLGLGEPGRRALEERAHRFRDHHPLRDLDRRVALWPHAVAHRPELGAEIERWMSGHDDEALDGRPLVALLDAQGRVPAAPRHPLHDRTPSHTVTATRTTATAIDAPTARLGVARTGRAASARASSLVACWVKSSPQASHLSPRACRWRHAGQAKRRRAWQRMQNSTVSGFAC